LTAALGACATRAFVRPTGPSVPAPEGAMAWAEATARCGQVRSFRGALALTGRIGSRRIPGLASATLYVAATRAGQIGIEARVSGQLAFRLGGNAERATLLLREGNRVVMAPAGDIVDALIGLPVPPDRLLAVLTGCVAVDGRFERAERFGDRLQITSRDAIVFLYQTAGQWTVRAGTFNSMLVDYRRVDAAGPREVFIQASAPPSSVAVTLRIMDPEFDPALPPSAFAVNVPADAMPLSLDELRDAAAGRP
jgi:hypothetical protein